MTGLRSNAELHIGNYLGAILPMVELQKKHAGRYQLNMFIPDLHSFTTPIEHGKLYEQTIENLKIFVAAGLDIEQPSTFIYRQSYIPAHSEMTWILDCFTYFGELSRMTEFKDKRSEQANVTAGLFNYPVLMAADILLYGARWIPVGEDQRQHVEFTRDLAMRMNKKFSELFVVPEDTKKQAEFAGLSPVIRIRSLRNPQRKMSKSIEDPAGTIMLSDDPDSAADKVMHAETDSKRNINYTFNDQPGVSNLIQIIALLSGQGIEKTAQQWQGKSSYNDLKTEAAALVKDFLESLQAKLAQVNSDQLVKELTKDEAAMSRVAEETLLKVQKAVGLRPAN